MPRAKSTESEKSEPEVVCCPPNKKWHHRGGGANGPSGYVLFVAFIGAAVYFVQQVSGFWPIVLALLKACVWPAFVLYHVMQLLHI